MSNKDCQSDELFAPPVSSSYNASFLATRVLNFSFPILPFAKGISTDRHNAKDNNTRQNRNHVFVP